MTVVTITPAFIIDRLNTLPPHSRLRPGYVDLMRHIRKEELANDQIGRMLVDALDLMDVSDIQRDRMRETY